MALPGTHRLLPILPRYLAHSASQPGLPCSAHKLLPVIPIPHSYPSPKNSPLGHLWSLDKSACHVFRCLSPEVQTRHPGPVTLCIEPGTQQVLTAGIAWTTLAPLCPLCELQERRTGPCSPSRCSPTFRGSHQPGMVDGGKCQGANSCPPAS